MAEETMDANAGVAESSDAANQEVVQSSSPADAESATEQSTGNETKTETVPFHEHPRFKELIEEKNQLRRELQELHSRMSSEPAQKLPTPTEKALNKFTKAGLNPEIAKTLAEGIVEASNEIASQRVAPIEAMTLEQEVTNTAQRFAESHADFKDVQQKMYEIYKSLPDNISEAIANDKTGRGLELVYNWAKKDSSSGKADYDKGFQDALKQKNLKTSVSPSGGTTAPQSKSEYNDKDIDSMSMDEYIKNRETILKSRGIRKL